MTKEGGLLFYLVIVAYSFDIEVKHCRFCDGFDSLGVFWVFEILVWKSYRCIILELKKKKKKNLIDYL